MLANKIHAVPNKDIPTCFCMVSSFPYCLGGCELKDEP